MCFPDGFCMFFGWFSFAGFYITAHFVVADLTKAIQFNITQVV